MSEFFEPNYRDKDLSPDSASVIEDLKVKIQIIRDNAGDDERAHDLEDCLMREVLHKIAEGIDNAKELAALALTTKEIEFLRWYA